MAKKKNQKEAEAQKKKGAVEALRFQTHWGLKQLGHEEGNLFHQLVDAEEFSKLYIIIRRMNSE